MCAACGEPQVFEDPPEAWVGRVIDGKYAIEGILGIGGMGMVFEARRVLIGDQVALKVLFPRFLESPLQRRLFRDEAVAAARLSHENVVTVYDADVSAEGHAYIAMELLSGRTLKTVLRERAPMAAGELVGYMVEVCAGLEAAHRAQIIHRDLKPDNVFIEARDGRERVKLLDFGIAAMLDAERKDEKRQRLGTLRYMSPEQCRGAAVDGRADLYALGVVCYEALTRRRATGKTVSAVLEEVPEPPNAVLPPDRRIPPPLEGLLMAMLAKSPADRPPSAAAAGEAFAQVGAMLRGELPPAARPMAALAGLPTPAPPPSSGGRLWVGLALAVLVGVIGGLIWGLT